MRRGLVTTWGQPLLGGAIGLFAGLLFPGRHGPGLLLSALLGLAGASVAGWVGAALRLYRHGKPAALAMAALGAVALLLAYGVAAH